MHPLVLPKDEQSRGRGWRPLRVTERAGALAGVARTFAPRIWHPLEHSHHLLDGESDVLAGRGEEELRVSER